MRLTGKSWNNTAMAIKGFHKSGILPAEPEPGRLEATGSSALSPPMTVPDGVELRGWLILTPSAGSAWSSHFQPRSFTSSCAVNTVGGGSGCAMNESWNMAAKQNQQEGSGAVIRQEDEVRLPVIPHQSPDRR